MEGGLPQWIPRRQTFQDFSIVSLFPIHERNASDRTYTQGECSRTDAVGTHLAHPNGYFLKSYFLH